MVLDCLQRRLRHILGHFNQGKIVPNEGES
jgi:hypothetical protein